MKLHYNGQYRTRSFIILTNSQARLQRVNLGGLLLLGFIQLCLNQNSIQEFDLVLLESINLEINEQCICTQVSL